MTLPRLAPCLILWIAWPSIGSAESPMPLDMTFLRQFSETRGFTLGRPQKPKVTTDEKSVLFLRAEPKTPRLKLFELTIATGMTRELLSPESILKGAEENLTPEEKARRERQRVSVGGLTDFFLSPDGGRVLVKLSNHLYVLDRATSQITKLRTGDEGAIVDPKWSPDGTHIAYVRGFDVYAYDLAAGRESPVTKGGTREKTNGLAEFVAQEEMHRHSGFWWSPDSRMIAYEEADHAGVEVWHIADPLRPDVAPAPQFYPRPGKKNVTVRLGVIPVSGGTTTWIDWDRVAYEYLARVQWDKHGPLTLMLQPRNQRTLHIVEADPSMGHTRRLALLEAKDVPWINLEHTSLHWGKDGSALLCREIGTALRSGDGPNRVYDATLRYLHLDKVVSFDPDTAALLVQGSRDPRQMHAWRVISRERIGGQVLVKVPDDIAELTSGAGTHGLAGSDQHPIITASTPTTMPVTRIVDPLGKPLVEVPSVALDPGFVPNVQFVPDPPFRRLAQARSELPEDECYAGIVRPRDFDAKKRYPVIVSVYGGPTSRVVSQAMAPWLMRQWLADQGFIVVAIDNRGTTGRGPHWESAVYQNFGTVPLDDQVRALSAFCARFPELDGTRAGMVGWSFGGYMAANAVLRRPDVFKAAVAGASVTDWTDYDTHYTERYLGLLPESKAAYDDGSLLGIAGKLSRPLLLVHGTADDNVYYRHTLKLADALFRAGRDFETLPLPGVTHMYASDPIVMERLWTRTAGFFKTHLGGPR